MGSIQSVNIDAMLRYTFVPDYSVRAVSEVMYLRVKRSFYMAAKRATLMERSKKMSNAGEFDEEVDKVIEISRPGDVLFSRVSGPSSSRFDRGPVRMSFYLARAFDVLRVAIRVRVMTETFTKITSTAYFFLQYTY